MGQAIVLKISFLNEELKVMVRILAVILARGGSKAIDKKNLVPIAGHPLLAYTISEALRSKYINRVIVSSDDDEIRTVAVQYGAEAPFRRPEKFSGDTARPVDGDLHATRWAENDEGRSYDYVVELLCTNPFKTSDDIDAALEMQMETNADSVIGVMHLDDHHPIRIKRIVDGKIRDFCLEEIPESRRQDLKPKAYIRNGSIYSMRRDMLEKGIRYGTNDSRAFIMPREKTVNIDEPMDVFIAQILMEQSKREYVKPIMTYEEASQRIKNGG
jgi:CMP-N-acetylneuraminic acid synthetase